MSDTLCGRSRAAKLGEDRGGPADRRGAGIRHSGDRRARQRAARRRGGILDALEEQPELERLEFKPPLGRVELRVPYLYSHTRISESSRSVSTGLVM